HPIRAAEVLHGRPFTASKARVNARRGHVIEAELAFGRTTSAHVGARTEQVSRAAALPEGDEPERSRRQRKRLARSFVEFVGHRKLVRYHPSGVSPSARSTLSAALACLAVASRASLASADQLSVCVDDHERGQKLARAGQLVEAERRFAACADNPGC